MMFDNIKMNKRINDLENENEILREIIKDELYKDFIEKLGEPEAFARIKAENKRLRLKIKELRGLLDEKGNKRQGKKTV